MNCRVHIGLGIQKTVGWGQNTRVWLGLGENLQQMTGLGIKYVGTGGVEGKFVTLCRPQSSYQQIQLSSAIFSVPRPDIPV